MFWLEERLSIKSSAVIRSHNQEPMFIVVVYQSKTYRVRTISINAASDFMLSKCIAVKIRTSLIKYLNCLQFGFIQMHKDEERDVTFIII